MNKVAYLTVAHLRYDAKIFIKQCRSLESHEYEIALLGGAEDKDDQCKERGAIL